LQARDAFILPSDTINNKLGVAVLGNFIYVGNGTKWTLTSGGASSTSIDSLRRSKDSIYARKNGQFIFQYKDSIGSGGGDTAKSYATTIKLTDTSYRLIRTNNTADTFLFTSALVFDSTSLSNRINNKINISDSAAMLSPYIRKVDTLTFSNRINSKINISDSAAMLSPYIRKVDTLTFSNRINSKINISDSATMLANYARKNYYTFSTGLTNASATITNNLSVGVSGGQSIKSGTAASDTLRIYSTTNATKGKIIFGNSAYDEANNRLGIGTTSPATPFEISGNSLTTNSAQFGTIGIQSYATNNAWFGDNVYFDNSAFRRRAAGYAGLFYFAGQEGQFRWGTTSTAGSVVNNGSSLSGLVSLKTNLNGTFAVGDLPSVANTYTGAKFIVFGATGNAAIGTATDNGFKLDVIGTARATQFQISALNTAPATATSTGVLGEIRIVNGAIYVCVATNTWQRALLTTF
jgi:hypothetical protein